MGTCWATNSWAVDSWATGSWEDYVPSPFEDGLYFLLPLGGGVTYIKKL